MKYSEINFNVIPEHTFSLFIGKRGTGKTNLMIEHAKNICKNRSIEKIFVIDPTEKYNNYYKKKLDIENVMIYYSLNNSTWHTIIDEKIKNIGTECLLIVENVAVGSSLKTIYRDIMFNSINLTILWGTQYLEYELSRPEYINNYDFLFLARENNLEQLQKYHKKFWNEAVSFEKFKTDFITNTENFNFIVLHKPSGTFFSHNAKYLLTIGNKVVTVIDYSDLLDMVDWLGLNENTSDIVLPKIMGSVIPVDTRICIEV
ncbi:hypothetical protein QJ857_gp0912 [Tupanvirus soda lake]|uniref:Uncharacterized protein n=2 Tax=Tupanvirus TaxID=2094720 RepID=A0A6N1NM84_9VIRU|nr:hypothetical protein QJ857_gp0912 [Tupanvirus soda lake]QKU35140.1 hypothetical protein [Tupanvirus soda lake]